MANNAAIYISDPSIVNSKLFKKFSAVTKIESKSDGKIATGMNLYIGEDLIRMNFMPDDEISQHLEGFSSFVNHKHQGTQDELIYILSRIHFVRLVIGCVIDRGFDGRGEIVKFLENFNGRLNGMLFINNELLDYDRTKLI